MTQDEIIEMAKQTGVLGGYEGEPSLLIIFAKAMMDVEREACAKVCEDKCSGQSLIYVMAMADCAEAIRARGQE